MAIDPNLAMNIGRYGATQMPDYGNMLAQATNIQGARQQQQMNALKMQEAQLAQQSQQQLNALIPQAMTPEGSLDYGRLSQLAAEQGLYGAIPGLQTAGQELASKRATMGKTMAETRQQEVKTGADVLEQTIRVLGPTQNQQQWSAGRQMLAQMFGPEAVAKIPEEWSKENADLLNMQGIAALERMRKTPTQLNLGGAVVQGVVDPLTGKFTESAVGVQVPSPAGVEEQKIRIAQASRAPGTTVNVGAGEKEFEKELGKGKAKIIENGYTAAQDAVAITDTINTGRQLLSQGMVTGAGAEYLVNFGQALKQVGIDISSDATSNSQAYAAAMANNVGRIIKLFGAGTGLSNADREYAEKMAGGKITLDERALRRILDINEKLARDTITRHNANVDKFGAGDELKINLPPSLPSTSSNQQALEWARQNRGDPRAAEILRRLGAR
jgi:hypothetical protein